MLIADKNPHLSIYLNQKTTLQIEIIPEEFLVESVRSLYFHLSNSPFIKESNGCFSLNSNVGTLDHTPQSLQSILRLPLKAASYLYDIKQFVTRISKSSLQSVLQEAVQINIIAPFYESLEKNKTKSLLNFVFKMRPIFADLKYALDLVNSPKPLEIAFARANAGSKKMMNICVMCLHLFADLCKEAITIHNSPVLKAPDFFIQVDKNNEVKVVDLPSAVPIDFAEDIARAATSLLIKAPPMRLEYPSQNEQNADINFLPYQMPQNIISFELLLPTEVPVASTPLEAISNFRAAAWSITLPKPAEAEKIEENYENMHEAIESILLQPLWENAKKSQRELVNLILKEHRLLDVVDILASLYLMRRGDIHINYINGYYRYDQATVLFQQNIKSVPFLEYRFISPNTIVTVIPPRLRKIITTDQLKVYLKYYQWILKIKTITYKLSTMEFGRIYTSLRMQLSHFFLSLYQITFSAIEEGFYKLKTDFLNSHKFEDLIEAHKKFVNYISIAVLTDQENISSEITAILDFTDNFCDHAPEMDPDDINQHQQQFISFTTYLNALLAIPAKKNPNGMVATLLNSMM